MRKIAQAVAVVALTVGLGAAAAPTAVADIVFINESGPGDVAYNHVENSRDVQTSQLDKSVEALIQAHLNGKLSDVPATFEVEGTEQDQGEES